MKILVAKEKHSTRYLRASNPVELHASALKLVLERWEDGYWYVPPSALSVKAPAMTLEAAQALPDGEVKTLALKEHRYAKSRRAQHAQDVEDYARIERVVKDRDGAAAWQVLWARRDYEYEGVQLEDLE